MMLAPNKKDLEAPELQKWPDPGAEREFWDHLDAAALMQEYVRVSTGMFSNIEAKWGADESNRIEASEKLRCRAVLFETSQADFRAVCDRREQYDFETSHDIGLWRSIRVAGLWLRGEPQPPAVFSLGGGKLVKVDGLHRIAVALCGQSRISLYAPEAARELNGFVKIS